MSSPASSTESHSQLKAVGCLIGGISSFQIGATLAKGLFPLFGPTGMVGLRVCLAAVILLCIWRPTRGTLTVERLKLLLPYGAAVAIMNFCFYVALVRLPLGVVVALEFTGPLTLALVGSRRWLDLCWAGLVVAGLFLLLRPEGPTAGLASLNLFGVAAALLSGCGWVVYILTGTRMGKMFPAPVATTLGMSTAAILLLPCLIPTIPTVLTHPWQGGAALSVAVLSSAVPYILDMMAMRTLSPRDLGILLSMEPMLGALSGFVFLHEALSAMRWMGVLCIAAASAGNVLTGRQKSLH
ncbi:EamA family transporter [Gluconobacter albidus]|uniref:Permease n=1 Tax=Gluconobacter albidus TaxID=318683 RepID=A0AAW3QXW4_9PROT|nr:EamA family transporter [Gluconobacter albidus]KXV37587.1 permease [Gluconobacter albidus]GBQ89328.1 transporter EamA [Gluconobacter albidus NBRC 3250]GLQ69946.1 threonine transporter RhtB [Gluconobacter albidus]